MDLEIRLFLSGALIGVITATAVTAILFLRYWRNRYETQRQRAHVELETVRRRRWYAGYCLALRDSRTLLRDVRKLDLLRRGVDSRLVLDVVVDWLFKVQREVSAVDQDRRPCADDISDLIPSAPMLRRALWEAMIADLSSRQEPPEPKTAEKEKAGGA